MRAFCVDAGCNIVGGLFTESCCAQAREVLSRECGIAESRVESLESLVRGRYVARVRKVESWTQSVDAGRNIVGELFAESCCARSVEVRVVVRWNLAFAA